jgi:hypothetical protein
MWTLAARAAGQHHLRSRMRLGVGLQLGAVQWVVAQPAVVQQVGEWAGRWRVSALRSAVRKAHNHLV